MGAFGDYENAQLHATAQLTVMAPIFGYEAARAQSDFNLLREKTIRSSASTTSERRRGPLVHYLEPVF
jgi:hypothetical protein